MSFWDCKKCQEEYRLKLGGMSGTTVGDQIVLLEEQADIHDQEHSK